MHLSKGHYISQRVTSEMWRMCDSPLSLILWHPTWQEGAPWTSATSLTGISAFRKYQRPHLAAHKQQLQHSQMLYLAISWMQAASQSSMPHLWGRRKGEGTCVRYSSPGGQLGIDGGIGIQIAPSMAGWLWIGGGTNPPWNPMGCAWNP